MESDFGLTTVTGNNKTDRKKRRGQGQRILLKRNVFWEATQKQGKEEGAKGSVFGYHKKCIQVQNILPLEMFADWYFQRYVLWEVLSG